MPQVYPISAASWWSQLRIMSMTPRLTEALSHTTTRGGQTIRADQSARLWQYRVELWWYYHDQADAVLAQLEALQNAGGSFMAHPRPRNGPIADPQGAILGAATPTIASFDANARELGLTGLPVGYVLQAGDYLSFTYGTPTKFALHRVLVGGTADGTGAIGAVEVNPYIRPGAVVGAAVTLLRPEFKALIVPGSVEEGQAMRDRRSGIAFSLIQDLR